MSMIHDQRKVFPIYRDPKHGRDFECENIPLLMGIACSLIKQGPDICLNLQEVHQQQQQQPHQDYLFFNWHPRAAPERAIKESNTHTRAESANRKNNLIRFTAASPGIFLIYYSKDG